MSDKKRSPPPPYPSSPFGNYTPKSLDINRMDLVHRASSLSPCENSAPSSSFIESTSPFTSGCDDSGATNSNFAAIPPYPHKGMTSKCVVDIKCVQEYLGDPNLMAHSASPQEVDQSCPYLFQSGNYTPQNEINSGKNCYNPLNSLQQQVDHAFEAQFLSAFPATEYQNPAQFCWTFDPKAFEYFCSKLLIFLTLLFIRVLMLHTANVTAKTQNRSCFLL